MKSLIGINIKNLTFRCKFIESYNWAIEVKENGSIVGSIGLMNIDNNIENCEIGYCISRAFGTKG